MEGDLAVADMGHGMFFRAGTFDGAVRCPRTSVPYNYQTHSHTQHSHTQNGHAWRTCFPVFLVASLKPHCVARSISALQWLCNADKRDHVPQRRLKAFFTSLYKALARGSRCVPAHP